jgi:hypothetical protein
MLRIIHLSLNENGIRVVLYMTVITAMPVMIYKRENEIGYKTAVRRMAWNWRTLSWQFWSCRAEEI